MTEVHAITGLFCSHQSKINGYKQVMLRKETCIQTEASRRIKVVEWCFQSCEPACWQTHTEHNGTLMFGNVHLKLKEHCCFSWFKPSTSVSRNACQTAVGRFMSDYVPCARCDFDTCHVWSIRKAFTSPTAGETIQMDYLVKTMCRSAREPTKTWFQLGTFPSPIIKSNSTFTDLFQISHLL